MKLMLISSLQAKVTEQKLKIEELELVTSEPEINSQKFKIYSFVTKNSKTLLMHTKQTPGQGKTCIDCPQIPSDKEKLRIPRAKHHKKARSCVCEVCKTTFRTLNDARTHSTKLFGNMKSNDVVINMEELDENNQYNACSIKFTSNTNLENTWKRYNKLIVQAVR